MHKFAFTTKPPEASGAFNGLLNAVLSGQAYGDFDEALAFVNNAIDDNPDGAPRGFGNPGYTVAPRLSQIDPTSMLSIAIESAFRRNPIGTVGYTHHHRAIEYLAHISSMFAKWLAEFQTLYALASAAQAERRRGNFVRIDSVREVTYHDGDIEAFLAAVGALTDGNISYPASDQLDVDVIYNRVMNQLAQECGILDNVGYSVGEKYARRTIGMASIPKTGQNVCVLSSATYDALLSSPWKRILTIARARDLVEARFMERYNMLLDAAGAAGDYVTLAEGDDVLFLPRLIDGQRPTWASLTAAIDGRNNLSTQQVDGPLGATVQGSYSTARDDPGDPASHYFTDHWLNQFYTKGDLVMGLLDGSVNMLHPNALLTVLVNGLTDDAGSIIGDSDIAGSTGPLASFNYMGPHHINMITGSIDVVKQTGARATVPNLGNINDGLCIFTPLVTGCTSHSLPNGILYLGDCASATAVNWIEILRFLGLNYPAEAKRLMNKSGRAKRSLPTSASSLASFDALLAESVSNGQRDGYLESSMLAFNVARLTRAEQDGPIFSGSLESVANPGAMSISSRITSGYNGWDRLDNSDGRYLTTPQGITVNFEGPTPSRFTGEWDAGRYATWTMDFVSESIALGSANVETDIAGALLSYPYSVSATGAVQPRYIPVIYQDLLNNDYETFDELLIDFAEDLTADGNTSEVWSTMAECVTTVPGYNAHTGFESWHPYAGFKRGLGAMFSRYTHTAAIGADGHTCTDHAVYVDWRRHEPLADLIAVIDGVTYDQYLPISSHAVTHASAAGTGLTGTSLLHWLWDPCRAQLLGTSWHRWGGVIFSDVLPHPYLSNPVAIPTSAARMQDIVGIEAPNESSVGANLYGAAGGASNDWTAYTGLAMQIPVFRGSANTAPATCTFSDVAVINPSMGWGAKTTQLVAAEMGSRAAGTRTLTLNTAANPSDPDTPEVFPTFDNIALIRNGCQRSNFNSGTTTSVQRETEHKTIATPYGSTATTLFSPNVVEGETMAPLPPEVTVGATLTITGKGYLFEGDITTKTIQDIHAWMIGVYSGEKSVVDSPLSGFWGPWGAAAGFTSVEPNNVGVNYIANADIRANAEQTVKFGTSQTDVGLVSNDWFRKGLALTAKHARMRSNSLVNPWVRAMDSPGYVHLRYDNSQLGPVYAQVTSALLELGSAMQSGLENSSFLEIQIAN